MDKQDILKSIEEKDYKKAKEQINVFLENNKCDIELQKLLGL